MKRIDYVDRISEIIQDEGEYTEKISDFLKEIFDRIIAERKRDDIEIEPNGGLGSISSEHDELGNSYIEYISESGHTLHILKKGIDYIGVPRGISITTTTLLNEVKDYFDELREKRRDKLVKKPRLKKELAEEMIDKDIKRIINQIYRLLPLREEKQDWQKPLQTIIE